MSSGGGATLSHSPSLSLPPSVCLCACGFGRCTGKMQCWTDTLGGVEERGKTHILFKCKEERVAASWTGMLLVERRELQKKEV